MDKPVVAGKSPIPVDVKKGETYYCVHVGEAESSHFVMDHIKVLHLTHWNLLLRRMKQFIYVPASKLRIPHIVMVHTKIYNN